MNSRNDSINQVWLVLASYPRNFAMTIPSLLCNTAEPLRRSGHLAGVLVASIDGEQATAQETLAALQRQSGLAQQMEFFSWDEKELRENCEDTIDLAHSKTDPYNGTRPLSLERSIIFLNLLRKTYEQVAAKNAPVVFVRADLLQLEEYDTSSLICGLEEQILLPSWHKWHGYNDRLAIIPNKYLREYFLRFDKLNDYLNKVNMFHPETFLKRSLVGSAVSESLSGRYYRTREGGLVVPENFDASPSVLSRFKHRFRLGIHGK